MSPLRRLLGLARPVRGWIALAVVASIGALVANVALMAVAPYLISRATLVTGFAAVAVAVTAVRALAISRAAMRYVERYTSHLAALRILTRLRVWLYRAIEPLSPGDLPTRRTGDLLARLVADVDTLDDFFVRGLVPLLSAIAAGAVASAILAAFAPVLGLTLALFLVLGGLALPLASRRGARRPAGRLVERRAELHAGLADDLAGLADLIAFDGADRLDERVGALSRGLGRERGRLASVRGASAGVGALVAGLAGVACLVLGIGLVRQGALAGVVLASVPLVAIAAFEAVLPLGDAFRSFELARPAAVRALQVADASPSVVDPADPLPPPSGTSVELRGVRFGYGPGAPPVLDGLSFELAPGEHLAISGPSGAGKSTIVGLLLRAFDPQVGTVLLDGCDLRSYRADDVRAVFGVVPQDVVLFNGTLRDNLLLADGRAPDERIAEACARAQLGDLLASAPLGLDTPVGEDGMKLSGGERQRVALARVFLRDAPILVLDEATTHLDAVTEARVLREIRAFVTGRTSLIVSHRARELRLGDRVLALPSPRAGASPRGVG